MGNLYGLKKSGITEQTPKSLLLGAGTIYKNLKWNESKWEGTVIGATSGGSTFKYEPNLVDVEVDGALVAVKGLKIKQGETCSLETNMVELSAGALQMAMLGAKGSSEANGFDRYDTKANIEDSDYLDNIAYVGFQADDTPVVIVIENAICTSGLELSGKNKEASQIKATFEPSADIVEGSVQDRLPVHIYYPTAG